MTASLLLVAPSLNIAELSTGSILDKSCRYIAGLDKYTFDALITDHVVDGDKVTVYQNTYI